MKDNTGLKVIGILELKVIDSNGNSTTRTYKNIITAWGLSTIAAALTGILVTPALEYLAIGEGSTPETVNDAALVAETNRDQASVTHLSGEDANKVVFYKLWAEGEVVGSFTEAGIFNDPTLGNMLNRRTFPPITVGVTNSFEITWTIEFLNS